MDTVFNDYDGMYGSTAAGSADEAGVEKAEEDTGLIFNEIREMESIAYDVAEPYQIVSYDAAGLEEYFGTKDLSDFHSGWIHSVGWCLSCWI